MRIEVQGTILAINTDGLERFDWFQAQDLYTELATKVNSLPKPSAFERWWHTNHAALVDVVNQKGS